MKKIKITIAMTIICMLQIICTVLVFADTETADLQLNAKSENGLIQMGYESGTEGIFLTFGEQVDGKLIVAQYDDDVLGGINTYEINNTTRFQIPNKDVEKFNGKIKCMLWSDFQEFKPNAMPIEKKFESVSLSAEDIDADKTNIDSGVIYFYPPGETGNSKKYEIADNISCYVNGVYSGVFNNDILEEFIINDSTTTVTLQKESVTDSDELPLKYNKVMITKYATAVVSNITNTKDGNRIQFKCMSNGIKSYIDIYENDDMYKYSFMLNGKEIDISEIQENDVLTIYYDLFSGFDSSNFYNVEVSRATTEGVCTSINTSGDLFTISGVKYGISFGMDCDFELATKYRLYLDIFNKIACAEEIIDPSNRGILKNIYRSANGDWVAEVINNEGIVKEYRVDESNVEEYQQYIKYESDSIITAYTQQVIDYRVNSSGEITIRKAVQSARTLTGKYSEETLNIGSIGNLDEAVIIDISGVDTMSHGVSAVSLDRLIDGEEYTIYAYDRAVVTGKYGFILITSGNLVEEEYSEHVGILTGVYQSDSGDWVANIVTQDCKSMEYVISYDEAEEYQKYIIDADNWDNWKENYPKQVVKYGTTKSGDFVIREALTGTLIKDIYSEKNSNIGSLDISDEYKMINIKMLYDYCLVSLDDLIDGEEYTIYTYKTENDSYELILFIEGNMNEEYTDGIGILKNIYRDANGEFKVEIVNDEGNVTEHKMSESDAIDVLSHFSLGLGQREEDYINQVVDYKLSSSNVLTIDEYMVGNESVNGEYTGESSSIGSIKISDKTILMDISKVEIKENAFRIISKDDLVDGMCYTAYGYGISDLDNSYRFVIVTSGTSGINSYSQLAVFIDVETDTDDNGNKVDVVTVYYNDEETRFEVDNSIDVTSFEEGDPIIFSVDVSGKIDEIYNLFESNGMLDKSDYETFRDNVFADGGVVTEYDWSEDLHDNKNNADIKFGVLVKSGTGVALVSDVEEDSNGYYIDLNKAVDLAVPYDVKTYTYNFSCSEKYVKVLLGENVYKTPDIIGAYENDGIRNKYYISNEDVKDNVVFAFVRTYNSNEVQEIYQIVRE